MDLLKDKPWVKLVHSDSCPIGCIPQCHVLVCVLGQFQILQAGRPVSIAQSGKVRTLFQQLALRHGYRIPRDLLLGALWPDEDAVHANQSLNSLVYSLRRSFRQAIANSAPLLLADGVYRLNTEAGIAVDAGCFEMLMDAGDRHSRAGASADAARYYGHAVELYHGDVGSTDVYGIIERERLRIRFLAALAHLADYRYAQGNFEACLSFANRLLNADPCREDAHRLIMRCYNRMGERAQAFRQYRLCQSILRAEFDTEPEHATRTLFDQLRLDPGSVS